MIDQHKAKLFQELFTQAESVLVIYAGDALRDHLFAATALYKSIQQNTNKSVSLLSNKDLSKIEKNIVYLDETRTEIGNQNLCISLDYSLDTVEKITSSIDEPGKKLHITIKPKKGVKPVAKESVIFSYTGADADMIVLVGVDDLQSLDQLYLAYEDVFQKAAVVSINSYETEFGNLKLDILGSSSVSEFTTQLLRSLEFRIDHETATNLLAGIDEETDNLESYLATADTFEVVSILLRHGARRFAREVIEEDSENKDSDQVFVVSNQDINIVDNQNLEIEKEQKIKKTKRRGRPKGSKNKKSEINKEKSEPKPGDLNYVPSGVGPSTT